uniref:Dermal papilla derived protein n=1 Tax=Rhipicephalus appendiculatus TaxID=34631 RepID=A0A131YWQ9_RHIAP
MGTFIGHTLTGSFLLFFGTWWTFSAWRNYVRSRENKQPYRCRCTYPVPCLSRKISIEGILKIASSCAGFAVESPVTFGGDGVIDAASAQHKSVYTFYMLDGIVDVAYNAGFPCPPNTDYAALVLAVISEGLQFYLHVHGRPHLDLMIHTLMVYIVAALVTCLLAEMCWPRSVLASLGRAYFCVLHGTWLWQIGFILYHPLPAFKPWDVNSPMDSMLAASAFAWHMMAVLVYVGMLGAVAWAVNRTCGRFCSDVVSVDAEEADELSETLIKHRM